MNQRVSHTLILGLGKRSTSYYVGTLHQKFHNKLGHYHTFPFTMHQIDFHTINSFLPNQFDTLVPEMTTILKSVSDFNPSKVLIPNITLHETIDKIDHGLNVVHPIQLTIDHCKAHNINCVVLLGSRYTMSSHYISEALKANGIATIKPSAEEQKDINDFRVKTYHNNDTESDFQRYRQCVKMYTNTTVVVTACTELSLHHDKLKNPKVVDMALLQIENVLK